MMRLDTAMIYAKDLPKMVAFYEETLGLRVITRSETWVELAAGGAKLGLHAIPGHFAEGMETDSLREETPLKLLFAVADVGAEVARLKSRGWVFGWWIRRAMFWGL